MNTTAKQRVYKSPEGQQMIQNLVRMGYESMTIDLKKRIVDSDCFGSTFICECGKPDGETVVLLHGTSSNSLSWMDYILKLKDDYHIVAIDLPGQPGLSSEQKMTFFELKDWFFETVSKIGLNSFHLVGMSLGGSLAISFATEHGNLLKSLSLIACGAVASPKIGGLIRIIFHMMRGEAGAKKIEKLLNPNTDVQKAQSSGHQLLADYQRAVNQEFIPFTDPIPLLSNDELGLLNIPVLYLAGAKDLLLNTAKTAARLHAFVDAVKIHVLEEYGHVIADQGSLLHLFISGEL